MDFDLLLAALSRPDAYSPPAQSLDVRQTHASAVFLTESLAFKIKKPVDFGFLDFTSLDRRRHYCEEEVRLNRRLAPDVYLGVSAIRKLGESVVVDGGDDGEIVEWAVKMRRLPDDARLLSRLHSGEIDAAWMEGFARKMADFHRRADHGRRISAAATFEAVACNIRQIFANAAPQQGRTISPRGYDRLRELFEGELTRRATTIESRAQRNVPCDCHGDLRLDHVYLLDETPARSVVVIDCIEFNQMLRFGDPVSDVAFLAMDLTVNGRRDLADAFTASYFREADDAEGAELLPLYFAYRAAVRGEVEGLELFDASIPDEEKSRAQRRSTKHWLLALATLESPAKRPALILVGGLPGTGKSTLARGLAESATILRSDQVRKELAGVSAQARMAAPFGRGIYADEWTSRTYAECLRRAERAIFEDQRVFVDATFLHRQQRKKFYDLADSIGVPAVFLLCTTDQAVAADRLAKRRGDISDADEAIARQVAGQWEEIDESELGRTHVIDTGKGQAESLEEARTELVKRGLA